MPKKTTNKPKMTVNRQGKLVPIAEVLDKSGVESKDLATLINLKKGKR